MDAIVDIGCIVARALGLGYMPTTVHHLTTGGKHGQRRRGHMYTIGLNQWSHLGVPIDGLTAKESREMLGPSYALEPRAFRQEVGSDDYLLDLQDTALREMAIETERGEL